MSASNAPVLGAIADDFTGATDLAGLLARSGQRVNLHLGVPDKDHQASAPFEVVALKCRTEPVDEALAQVDAAFNWLQKQGTKQVFWKYCSTFDSTPKSNIGPIAEHLLARTQSDQTIYCPAFPENGRSIFMGNLFVGDEPLAESPMKDHPLTPMRDSNLLRLLEPQVTKPVGLINRLIVAKGADAVKERLAQLKADGVVHVVVDAVADEDLGVIAQACGDMPLMTGGSAVAMPLPNLLMPARSEGGRFQPPSVGKGQIALSGSCSAMTRAQVASYAPGYASGAASYQLDPLALAKDGPGNVLAWLSQQSPAAPKIVYATAEPDAVKRVQAELGVAEAGELVEQCLAAIAKAALKQGVRRFVVAGGETSGAVAQALGVTSVAVGQEIAPGVPWTFADQAGESIALALKSGNFGSETFFQDAFDCLDRKS